MGVAKPGELYLFMGLAMGVIRSSRTLLRLSPTFDILGLSSMGVTWLIGGNVLLIKLNF